MPGNAGWFKKAVHDLDWILGKSIPVTESGCWIWEGYVNPKGYGMYRKRDGKNWLAHRFVFKIINGFLPKVVMHKCDNPCCVNPSHLEAGTHKQNSIDYVDRQGGNSGMFKQKVPDEIRNEIFKAEGYQSDIASKYGVDQSFVSRIKNNKDRNRKRFGG